jgi:hypothetical protein
VEETEQAYLYVGDDPLNKTDPTGMGGSGYLLCDPYQHKCGKGSDPFSIAVSAVERGVHVVERVAHDVERFGSRHLCKVLIGSIGALGMGPAGAASIAALMGDEAETLLGLMAFAGGLGGVAALGAGVGIGVTEC